MESIFYRHRILTRHFPIFGNSCFINSIATDRSQNANWIKKRLEDSRNKLSGVFQGASATTEVYVVFDVSTNQGQNLNPDIL